MDFADLRPHEGETVQLGGESFVFTIDRDGAGDWATFGNDDWLIYATLNYEETGIPFDLYRRKNDDFTYLEKVADRFKGVVKDWQDYISQVDTLFRNAKAKLNEANPLVV